jgi:hypothetical protein
MSRIINNLSISLSLAINTFVIVLRHWGRRWRRVQVTIIILRNSDMYFYLSLAQNNHRLEANTKGSKGKNNYICKCLKKTIFARLNIY